MLDRQRFHSGIFLANGQADSFRQVGGVLRVVRINDKEEGKESGCSRIFPPPLLHGKKGTGWWSCNSQVYSRPGSSPLCMYGMYVSATLMSHDYRLAATREMGRHLQIKSHTT
jgi:hypothetical protein